MTPVDVFSADVPVSFGNYILNSLDKREGVKYLGYMKNGIDLTPERAWCSAHDAANAQMRKAGRKAWNEDDYNLAVETQARLLRCLGHPYDKIAAQMTKGQHDER